MIFPYHGLDNQPINFERQRVRHPQPGGPKYLQKKGTGRHAYFPAASIPLLKDVNQPIFIVEGEKKALALSQRGLAVIGIGVRPGFLNKTAGVVRRTDSDPAGDDHGDLGPAERAALSGGALDPVGCAVPALRLTAVLHQHDNGEPLAGRRSVRLKQEIAAAESNTTAWASSS